MAGTARSGRRRLTPTTAELPEMGACEDSLNAYLGALGLAVKEGTIDPRVGDTLQKIANTIRQTLKQRADRTEMLDLKAMLDRAEAVVLAGVAKEVADRQRSAAE